MSPVQIPQRIDDPSHFLLWRADELIPLMMGLVLGILLHRIGLCLLTGFILTQVYKRFRDHRPDGYLVHLLYWAGLYSVSAPSFRNPFIRRYLP